MAKKAANTPLYQQLKEKILANISAGAYSKGQRIPTEKELSETFGMSRVTVRRAVKDLEKEGILVSYPKRGTFVAQHSFRRNISHNSSFTEICEASGLKAGAKTIKSVIEDATPEDVQAFGISKNSKVIVLERIRYADKIPVAIETSRFPESYSFLIEEDLNNKSMISVLAEKYNIHFTSKGTTTIKLVNATYEQSKYLSLPKGYPLISISCISYDENGKPCHDSRQLIVGDKFELYL